MRIPKKSHIPLLVVACIAIFMVNLDALYVNIMEARNFITAREMLNDGHWLLTTMNGEPRYQKPPLPTWLTAISAAIFGLKSLFALRLPAALIASVLVLVSYRFASVFTQNKSYAFISSLIMATSFYIVASGRDGSWDIFAHGFMLVCIYYLYLFFTEDIKKYEHAVLAALFLGCSFMSKGPVSLYALLLPFLISFGIVYRFRNFKQRLLPLLLFVAVSFLLSGWWHWYTIMNDPAAAEITKNETTNWMNYETKPFYYYWSFFIQSGIWTLPAFIALLYPYMKNKVTDKKAYLFTFLWTVGSVILLSLIPEKKSRYLLPVLIPMALNTGFYIEYLFRTFKEMKNKWETIPVYFNFGLIAMIGLVFPVGGYLFLKNGLPGKWIWFVLLSIMLFFIGILMFRNLFRKKIKPVFYLTIVFIATIICFGMPLAKAVTVNPEYKPMTALQNWQTENKVPVYELTYYTPELIWDYGQPIEVLAENGSIKIPFEEKFAVLVGQEDQEIFQKTFSRFLIEKITRYDMNPQGSDHSSHKTRLWRDLYLVRK